jgi:hypothetical protein
MRSQKQVRTALLSLLASIEACQAGPTKISGLASWGSEADSSLVPKNLRRAGHLDPALSLFISKSMGFRFPTHRPLVSTLCEVSSFFSEVPFGDSTWLLKITIYRVDLPLFSMVLFHRKFTGGYPFLGDRYP